MTETLRSRNRPRVGVLAAVVQVGGDGHRAASAIFSAFSNIIVSLITLIDLDRRDAAADGDVAAGTIHSAADAGGVFTAVDLDGTCADSDAAAGTIRAAAYAGGVIAAFGIDVGNAQNDVAAGNTRAAADARAAVALAAIRVEHPRAADGERIFRARRIMRHVDGGIDAGVASCHGIHVRAAYDDVR